MSVNLLQTERKYKEEKGESLGTYVTATKRRKYSIDSTAVRCDHLLFVKMLVMLWKVCMVGMMTAALVLYVGGAANWTLQPL